MIGPVTPEELSSGIRDGRFAASDLVQHGDHPIWHRAASVLAAEQMAARPGVLVGWREIAAAVIGRLRSDIRSASLATAGVCLLLGVAAWLFSRWPVMVCLPWFIPPVAAGVLALTRGWLGRGLLLLLSAAAVPALLSLLPAQTALESPESGVPVLPRVQAASAPAVPVVAEVPALKPEPEPAATPAPKSLLSNLPTVDTGAITARVRQLFLPPERPSSLKPVESHATTDAAAASAAGAVTAAAKVPAAAPMAPGDLVQRHRDAFIVIKGGEGHGSGFLCQLGGKTWLLTNNHVMAGLQQPQFTQLNGTRVAVGGADSATGYDLMRLALTQPTSAPLEAISSLEANVQINDDVVVLGNTGGGGVVTSLEGKLLGIGPDRVEVSSEFIPGNSGSPIVHVKTGKVIGIATYLTKRYEEFAGPVRGSKTGEVVVRRYGYRLDTVKQWEPVNWNVFHAEATQLQRISLLTGDVFDFLGALREKRDPQFSTETLRRPATEWFAKVGRNRLSEADRRSATQSFLASLRSMVRADVIAAESSLRYTFFRDELKKEREIRDRLYKSFDDEVKRMASTVGRTGF